jgi:hypothetical protein
VNTELRGNPRYRPDTEFVLPTKLLEQIHFGSPVHAKRPDLLGRPYKRLRELGILNWVRRCAESWRDGRFVL